MPKIVVVGSINVDMVMKTGRFPMPGETLLGGQFYMFNGGKGANQAVAAARLGGSVDMIARVGNDIFGNESIANLKADDINTSYIIRDEEESTGIAQILVADSGQNEIIVASGANGNVSSVDIDNATDVIKAADLILVQLEIPLSTVEFLVTKAKSFNCPLILNPAPAQALSDELLMGLYLITPNETEAGILTGEKVNTVAEAEKAAGKLREKGVEHVIITMGEAGALYKGPGDLFFTKANKVNVKDSTGAGDTFNGALAVALSEGKDWRRAIQFATDAAGLAVTRMGAQTSIPKRVEIDL